MRAQIDAIVSNAGLDPKMVAIDNACPDDATVAGATAADAAKEKLEGRTSSSSPSGSAPARSRGAPTSTRRRCEPTL